MSTGERVTFQFDGRPVEGFVGEPVAVSLWRLGIKALGRHEQDGAPRGAYCLIGHCFECRVVVDGRAAQRACLTPVRAGMDVRPWGLFDGPGPSGAPRP